MTTQEQSTVWGNFWQIVDLSKKLVSDFERLSNNNQELFKKISSELPEADIAYMHSIIINLGKIFFEPKRNKSFGLETFKNICRDELKKEIEKIKDNNKDIVGKIVTNRHKLVAHLDKDFRELPFSDNEKARMAEDMVERANISVEDATAVFAKMPKSNDKSQERYSAGDMLDDLPKIKQLVESLLDIWSRSIPFATPTNK